VTGSVASRNPAGPLLITRYARRLCCSSAGGRLRLRKGALSRVTRVAFAFAVFGTLVLSGIVFFASTAVAREDVRAREARTILEFDTMTPVVAPFTGSAHSIRGIGGGGVPWALRAANGQLDSAGRLEVSVVGLVVASAGVNPVATFVAAVNCLTTASPDTGTTLLTAPQGVGANGNATFDAKLNLPSPCVAPIVFVGIPAGTSLRWFAATGS
jgi:hypothetical protein